MIGQGEDSGRSWGLLKAFTVGWAAGRRGQMRSEAMSRSSE
nr:MAG TPA: hypothetical protein [Caudoviricetes sp.]